jgi:hypothetical protein
VTYAQPYPNGPPIRSDGFGYHLWTRVLLTRDFRVCDFIDQHDVQTTFAISHVDQARQICQIKYAPGLALLRLPFMLAFVNLGSPTLVITPWEHRMSLFCGALALVITWLAAAKAIVLLRVHPSLADAVVFLHMFGTGLFHYGTYDSSFTHAYSAALLALLALAVIRSRDFIRVRHLVYIAAIAMLLVLLRQTNVLVLCWGCLGILLLARSFPLRDRANLVCTIGVGCLFALSLLVWYNVYATGQWTFFSYGEEKFIWQRPMWRSVLFSYERGLFTYYPILLVSALLALCCRFTRVASLLAIGCVLSYALLYGFWHSWFLGAGFGHRGFVELVPAFAILAALALDKLTVHARNVLLVAMAITMAMTLALMLGYWSSTLPFGGADKGLYFAQLSLRRLVFAICPLCVITVDCLYLIAVNISFVREKRSV